MLDESEKIPMGFAHTLKALIESRAAKSFKEVIEILNTVKISENDYPWLYDVILVGKAEAANRFDKNAEEEDFLEEFWVKHPFLFEPSIVFKFGLDNYQEKLKKIYVAKKKGA